MSTARDLPRYARQTTGLVLLLALLLSPAGPATDSASGSEANAAKVRRCSVPSPFNGNFFRLRAVNTSCREARRVLRNRRCSSPCRVFISRGKAGRYRCPTRPNNIEGANFRCSGPGARVVTFASGS